MQDSKTRLARSLIGMVVRAGAATPDISSVEAFRSTLLAAKSIAYSDSGSGTYLSTTLFPKLGIADQVAGKSRKVRGPPSGEPVAAVVARGEAEIGFQQVSELIRVPGITFVGTIPTEVQVNHILRRGTHQYGSAARSGWCAHPLPIIARRGAGDFEGRVDATVRTIARAIGSFEHKRICCAQNFVGCGAKPKCHHVRHYLRARRMLFGHQSTILEMPTFQVSYRCKLHIPEAGRKA